MCSSIHQMINEISNQMDSDVRYQISLIGLLIKLLLYALDWQTTKLGYVLDDGNFITQFFGAIDI